jgi:hypothetical protein
MQQRTALKVAFLIFALLGFGNSRISFAQATSTYSIDEALRLRPGATCLESDRLVEAIKRIIPEDAIDSRIRVDVLGDRVLPNAVSIEIWRANEAYAMRHFDDVPGDCQQLHSLVALAIVFAIDATWLAKRTPERPLPTKESPSVSRAAIGIDANIASGAVLGTGLGGDLRGELSFFSWLELRGTLLILYSGNEPVGKSSGSVDSILTAGRLDACGSAALQSWVRMRACLGGAVGGYTTIGRDYDQSNSDTTLWIGGSAGVDGLFTLSENIKLVIGFDGLFPLAKRTIDVRYIDITGSTIRRPEERSLGRAAVVGHVGPLFYFY